MLAYQIRLALRSLRRNPVLSGLMIAGIALGIGVSMVFVTAYYLMSGNPIPHKSDKLHYVQVDSWNPQEAIDPDYPKDPPFMLTYQDMTRLMESAVPTRQTASFRSVSWVHPTGPGQRPFREAARLCSADYFPMFDLPFRHGAGWSREADRKPDPVVVLGDAINRRLFGGDNSVGRTLRIEDRDFQVVGVLAPWNPKPRFDLYDPFGESEEIYLPFGIGVEARMSPSITQNWRPFRGGYMDQDFLASETVWIQMWVELHSAEQRQRYLTFLNAYAAEQKKLGRFGRPINNRVDDLMTLLRSRNIVPAEVRALLIIALLFLLACSVNLIGILLGKFLARAPEMGVRRALGASRRWVFIQHVLECEVIGVAGGLLGLLLSAGGLRLLDRLFEDPFHFRLDATMFLFAFILASLAALTAGLYPAWRICRVSPSAHLKAQ